MNAKLVRSAEDVIARAMRQGHTVPALIAAALESACLLQSPETAAELEQWRATFGRRALPDALARLERAESGAERLRARVAELESERHTTNEALADADAEREKLLRWHREDSKQITKLVAQRERRRVRLNVAEADLLEMRGLLSPADGPRRIAAEVEIHERVAPAVEWLLTRVTELEAELYTERAQHRTTLEQRNAHARELLALRGGRATSYTATAEAHAQMREGLTRYFAGQQAATEEPHDSPLRHDYRVGHDLPKTDGAR
ncbi:hypothetical protein [Streptomyces sp. NPDC004042]|uniref:hypothetical protein n=1 Tax=Streptomyces sp. NPDC004042 TaxID=3154451 RepID=UPI0033ABA6F0